VAEAESAEREVDELEKKIQAATQSLKGERRRGRDRLSHLSPAGQRESEPGFVSQPMDVADCPPPAGLQAEVRTLETQASAVRSETDGANARLEARRVRLRECDAEIRGLEKERAKLLASIQDVELDCKRAEHKWVAMVGRGRETSLRSGGIGEETVGSPVVALLLE